MFTSARLARENFYPRPPGGGRPSDAARVRTADNFYPRPPGGGRPVYAAAHRDESPISIHALRVEGDAFNEKLAAAANISIHALRVEGDRVHVDQLTVFRDFYPRPPGGGRPGQTTTFPRPSRFLSTPSGWRATSLRRVSRRKRSHFYPRPPGGGRPGLSQLLVARRYFYPRPPGGGRPLNSFAVLSRCANFYPRPPGGGRPRSRYSPMVSVSFLSTPSGWSATPRGAMVCQAFLLFLSTPSGWRATECGKLFLDLNNDFYPRPPGGGRPTREASHSCSVPISIHALRVEGDAVSTADTLSHSTHFYPRPPGGGRRSAGSRCAPASRFLSTPSGWRATETRRGKPRPWAISIHALRVEGDIQLEPPAFANGISIHALRVEGD